MKTYTLSVSRSFSAAHALRGYKGKCERLHGHTWRVRVAVRGRRLNSIGILIDFTLLREILDRVIAPLDHAHINEIRPFTRINPSAENIAAHIFDGLSPLLPRGARLAEVEVWESEHASATVTAK